MDLGIAFVGLLPDEERRARRTRKIAVTPYQIELKLVPRLALCRGHLSV
jgi:hypothetical protein